MPAGALSGALGVALGFSGVIVVVVDNGMYGTIRMHQEREYPKNVAGSTLVNPDFVAHVRKAASVDRPIVLICRSGNRSAQAASQMEAAGLTVVDGGGLTDMQSAGWSFVASRTIGKQ